MEQNQKIGMIKSGKSHFYFPSCGQFDGKKIPTFSLCSLVGWFALWHIALDAFREIMSLYFVLFPLFSK